MEKDKNSKTEETKSVPKNYKSTVRRAFNFKGKTYKVGDKFETKHELTHKQLLTDKRIK